MKRKISFMFIAMLAAIGLHAQSNLNFGDFEDGTSPGWNQWGGTIEVVDNPDASGENTSAKVLEYKPAGVWQGATYHQWGGDGIGLTDQHVKIVAKFYSSVEGMGIQLLVNDKQDDDAANFNAGVKAIGAVNTWVTLEWDITDLTHFKYQTLAFQNTVNGDFFIDDVFALVAQPVSAPDGVILDPATIDESTLDPGMTIVEIDGVKYLRVILNSWNAQIPIGPYLTDNATHINLMTKYAVSTENTHTIDQVNTFIKFFDPEVDPDNISDGGQASSANFVERKMPIQAQGTIRRLLMAGQLTTNWTAVTGDTLWISKITLQYPPTETILAAENPIDVKNIVDEDDYSALAKLKWDDDNFYITIEVTDDVIFVDSLTNVWERDNIEIYIDMLNEKKATMGTYDYQIRLTNNLNFYETGASRNSEIPGVDFNYKEHEGGYTYTLVIPWDSLMLNFDAKVGTKIGFDILASDNDGEPNFRDQLSWNSISNNLWRTPYYWGVLELDAGGLFKVIKDTEAPTVPANLTADVDGRKVTLKWDASTDNSWVKNYIVLQNGVEIATTALTNRVINNLEDGAYTFSIKAADIYDNVSVAATVDVVINTTSVIEPTSSIFTVYPNPASAQIAIQGVRAEKIDIYSINGSLVKTFISTNTISVAELDNGIYIIKVQSANNVHSSRFIKK